MKNCVICGKKIRYPKEPWDADTLHPKKYCYYKCIKKSKNVLRRIRVEKTHEKTWPRCHEKFTSKRRDTEYCSNKCRQATYRERATYGEDARKIKVIVLIDGYCPACHRFKEILESFRGDPRLRITINFFSLNILMWTRIKSLLLVITKNSRKLGCRYRVLFY